MRAFTVVWVINYIPLHATVFGRHYSPRLALCKLLIPFDIGISLTLVMGSWVSITTAVTGISMAMYHVLSGLGLTAGLYFTRKVLVPKWQGKFLRLCKENK